MAGFRLYTGNRLERLAGRLAGVLEEPLSSPLEQEIIVVQSRGMARWLSMQLAREHGVCANCAFPFPNRVLADLFSRTIPDAKASKIFETDAMAFRIVDLLPGLLDQPGFETLKAYLEDDPAGMKLFQLGASLSELYRSYLIYRPGMVLGWQQGRMSQPESLSGLETWQCALWRLACGDQEGGHLASLRERFFDALETAQPGGLPERISLFGLSSLPRFHLEAFHALSRHVPVHVFALNPCRQYWGDIRSDREIAAMEEKTGLKEDELHLEEGNGILAAMGRAGRDLFDTLQNFELEEEELFDDIPGGSLLECIQADILDLRNTPAGSSRTAGTADISLQIHSCHSTMREVEVLRDNLLSLLEGDRELRPEDIVVMAPDVREYAPCIHAVFDVPRTSPLYLPYAVADMPPKDQGLLVNALLGILELSSGRFEATRVVALLECEPVRRRFGLNEADLDTILAWIRESGIRWGQDGAWKVEQGVPGSHENTWGFGMDRLLLGYAMTPEDGCGFCSILPCEGVEGDRFPVLGAFLDFVSTLFARTGSLREKRTAGLWAETLASVLEEFFEPDESLAAQMQSLRACFQRLAEIEQCAGLNRELSCEVIRAYLGKALGDPEEGGAYLSGGVTFCTAMAMRSVPFEVVCLLGMNHAVFPRQQRARGFDLIGRRPRSGDRSLRDEDLYLFLEALLSARSVFYVSYVGQSIEDNSPIPPAVPVSILLDYLDSGPGMGEGRSLQDAVLRKHCLQAFNPAYFSGKGRLFSYSRENAAAAATLARRDVQERVFVRERLPEPPEEWRSIDIGSLCRFYRNPSRFLLERRLSMGISEGSFSLDDCEPMELSELEKYTLRKGHAERLLAGRDPELSRRVMRMSGLLPHGAPGEVLFSRIHRETEEFVRSVKASTQDAGPIGRTVDLRLGRFGLTGSLSVYPPGRVVHYRPVRQKASDLLAGWIEHLALCSMSGGAGHGSCCIFRDRAVEFAWVENSPEILERLLEYYWEGISRPLPFFPETSREYAMPGSKTEMSREERLKKARKKWLGSSSASGEVNDLACRICFPGLDPLSPEFEEVSLAVFGPLIAHERSFKP
jgi:exodeoxyribonuclease V gamma subunit